MFDAQVITDSISKTGSRLTSIQAEYPRVILAETNTHTLLSKNTSSSRAMPVSKMLEQVEKEPYEPVFWGKNQSGMKAREQLSVDRMKMCKMHYDHAKEQCIISVKNMMYHGLAKQDANRLLEPWSWTKQILTGTQVAWANFFGQRTHQDAHPAMQRIARLMYLAYRASKPVELDYDQWHLPYVTDEDREKFKEVSCLFETSVARCARVSYWDHEGTKDLLKDRKRYQDLCSAYPKHMSPFQHQARPMLACELAGHPEWRSNLDGWLQYRKLIPGECIRVFEPSDEEVASWNL